MTGVTIQPVDGEDLSSGKGKRLIIPYRVDVPLNRLPITNCIIIGLTVCAYLGQRALPIERWEVYVLEGWSLSGLLGCMWLHGGIFHLAGNMIFLWVFGNAVCAKMGNLRYPIVYVGLGILSSVAHVLTQGGSAVGASGAINGVVGMYLVWYPLNDISCFYLLFGIGTFTVSSYWMIALWFVFDIWGAVHGGGGVAYFAHIGGFVGGFVVAIALLKLRMVRMDEIERSLLAVLGLESKTEPLRESAPDEAMSGAEGEWTHITPSMIEVSEAKRAPGATRAPPEPQASAKPPPVWPGAERRPAATGADNYIRFDCVCGARIKVPREWSGKRGRCKKCGNEFQIPT